MAHRNAKVSAGSARFHVAGGQCPLMRRGSLVPRLVGRWFKVSGRVIGLCGLGNSKVSSTFSKVVVSKGRAFGRLSQQAKYPYAPKSAGGHAGANNL